ncbi:MAG: AtpZ/AtpI family protein [Polyangiaceae bacterium]|nr:AtpZ/AtpI family protein [Polyangiaceae bacterium]
MQQNWKGLGTYGTVGLEFVLSFLFGLWLGHQGDKWFGTAPWLTLTGSGFGLAAGFRAIWQAGQRATREAEQEERRERAARKKYLDDHHPRDPGR